MGLRGVLHARCMAALAFTALQALACSSEVPTCRRGRVGDVRRSGMGMPVTSLSTASLSTASLSKTARRHDYGAHLDLSRFHTPL